MQLYNVCTDQTDEVSIAFYCWSRFRQLKYDIARWLWFSTAVAAGQVCQKCVQKQSKNLVHYFDQQKMIKRIKNNNEIVESYWFTYYQQKYPKLHAFLVRHNRYKYKEIKHAN